MSDSKLTQRIGALVWLGVFLIYFATMAPTTSFWDTGEFIASAYTLGVPHPPGSPLFNLLGRLFSMVPIEAPLKAVGLLPDFADIAARVNIMSPLAGAFSALFCYLIILRLIGGWRGELRRDAGDGRADWTAQVGAVVGTFIFALADSNWFNAVEAEVYAYAIFLMMLALWLGLKWADSVGKPEHMTYALFIAYLMGLAGGMHMLCLLVLPSIGILALFTYVHDRRDSWTLLGAIALLVTGAYFAQHALNAARLVGDQMSEPASTYGISDDPITYQQISITLAVMLAGAGVVLSFLTRTVNWRDTWAVLLIGAAAAATVQTATGIFYWSEGVQSFPSMTLLAGFGSGALLFLLTSARQKPNVPVIRGYHLSVALLVLAVVGYWTYLSLMIRSGLNPVIDENNPESWGNFFNFIARKQYGNESMSLLIFQRRAPLEWQYWHMLVKYLFQQFPASITGSLLDWKIYFRSATDPSYYGMRVPDLPLVLMFMGVVWHYENDKKRFLAIICLWAIAGIGLSTYLNMPDPQPRERHYVFTGATSVMAIWMGMGVTGLIRSIPGWIPATWPEWLRLRGAGYSVAAVGLLVPVWFLTGYPLVDEYSADRSVRYDNWTKSSRHHDTIAYDYAYNILNSCAPNAVLFTNGDNDTFPLWYLQEVAGVRKDVRIVNLSLLNTDWYIQQLRDNEPRLPIRSSYTDAYISDVLCGSTLPALIQANRIDTREGGSAFSEEGRLIGWTTKEVSAAQVDTARVELVDGTVVRGIVGDTDDGSVRIMRHGTYDWETIEPGDIARVDTDEAALTWTLAAPSDYRVLRVQDVMVYNIIHWVKWERPVYFAVTVSSDNRLGLDRHLRMEGMALKVELSSDARPASQRGAYGLNPEATEFNLDSVYVIRNLLDQEHYKDDNMLKLISNYRSAYLQLADTYIRRHDFGRARATLEKMRDRLPLDWRASYTSVRIASEGGPALRDLTVEMALNAGEVLVREFGQVDVFDQFMLERARMTAQLLSISGEPAQGAELLMSAEPRVRESEFLTPFDRIALLYEAGMSYQDAGRLERARDVLEEVRGINSSLAGAPDEALGRALRMDPRRFVLDVDRRLAEIAESMARDSAVTDDD